MRGSATECHGVPRSATECHEPAQSAALQLRCALECQKVPGLCRTPARTCALEHHGRHDVRGTARSTPPGVPHYAPSHGTPWHSLALPGTPWHSLALPGTPASANIQHDLGVRTVCAQCAHTRRGVRTGACAVRTAGGGGHSTFNTLNICQHLSTSLNISQHLSTGCEGAIQHSTPSTSQRC